MMRRLSAILCVAVLCTSCVFRPRGVLSRSEMVEVLLEIHRTEAIFSSINSSTSIIERQEYYNSIFRKHGIDKATFDASLAWYTSHPKQLQRVYTDVTAKCEQFNYDVEHYKYSKEYVPSTSTRDSLNIWLWRPSIEARRRPTGGISVSELRQEFNDTLFFGRRNKYRLRARMVAYSECRAEFRSSFVVQYTDGKSDTTACTVTADSVTRWYKFAYVTRADANVRKIKIEFIDSSRHVNYIKADNIILERIYDTRTTTIHPKMIEMVSQRQHMYKNAW